MLMSERARSHTQDAALFGACLVQRCSRLSAGGGAQTSAHAWGTGCGCCGCKNRCCRRMARHGMTQLATPFAPAAAEKQRRRGRGRAAAKAALGRMEMWVEAVLFSMRPLLTRLHACHVAWPGRLRGCGCSRGVVPRQCKVAACSMQRVRGSPPEASKQARKGSAWRAAVCAHAVVVTVTGTGTQVQGQGT